MSTLDDPAIPDDLGEDIHAVDAGVLGRIGHRLPGRQQQGPQLLIDRAVADRDHVHRDGVRRVDLGGEVPRLRRVPAHDVDARPAPPPARQLSRPPEASR